MKIATHSVFSLTIFEDDVCFVLFFISLVFSYFDSVLRLTVFEDIWYNLILTAYCV